MTTNSDRGPRHVREVLADLLADPKWRPPAGWPGRIVIERNDERGEARVVVLRAGKTAV